jgi:P27 family predicted phage terminase small subunit
LEGNPGKRAVNVREPTPPQGIPDCPEYLDDEGKGEWFRTVKVLQDMHLLSLADRSALGAYCTAYSRWIHAEEQVRKFGAIVKSPEKGFPMKSPYLCIADQALETMRGDVGARHASYFQRVKRVGQRQQDEPGLISG